MSRQAANPNSDPTMDVMGFALKELTKDWTIEEQDNFSKQCFDVVVQKKYDSFRRYPTMNPIVIEQ